MLEERDLKVDLLALGLLALTVFLAASLLSYDPSDPPSTLIYPGSTETTNVCGRSGAVVSSALFGALGLGAYYLLVSLAVLDSLLLARQAIGDPLLRWTGWLLSLLGFSTLAAMALSEWSPGPVIGSGGYLGAVGRGLLEMNFASVGAYIIVASVILAGLLLCTDYVLVRVLAWTMVFPARGLARGLTNVGAAYLGKLIGKGLNLADGDRDRAGPALRIGGVSRDHPEEDDQHIDEAEEEEAELGFEPSTDGDFGSPLRIRKPTKDHREELIEELEAATTPDDAADYELPNLDLLLETEPFCFGELEQDVRRKAGILEKTFADFGFQVHVVEIQTGPVIAQFEVELEAGLRLSKITGLADDLAIALRVPSVRIVAPIPGKNTVGIEVPNAERQLVRLREVIEQSNGKAQAMRIPIFLGKDVAGNPLVIDLSTLPHLLIAGRTGTGKSVSLNSIIASILMTRRPDEVRLLLVDPKMVELSPYKSIPHLMHPVVTDMRKAEAILAWAVEKMEERYQLLARAGVRHLSIYNQLGEEELMARIAPVDENERAEIPLQMPYIVIVADEMADLMLTAAKEVEGHIIRLAQKSRAVGIHLVLATQKPTVDVVTGLIKSNLPARICFEVASRTDSRVVLDEMGAERLLGNGDMLFLRPGTSHLVRGQGTYLCDDEIARVIAAVATSEPQFVTELVELEASDASEDGPRLNDRDELYEAAVDIVVREGRGSVSLLQRALGIGYGRAARLIDYMAEDGLVGPYNGSQAREVLISLEEWEASHGRRPRSLPATRPTARRTNKILLDAASHSRDSDEGDPPGSSDALFREEDEPEDEADVRTAVAESGEEDTYKEGDELEDTDWEDEDCEEFEDGDEEEEEEYDEDETGDEEEYEDAEDEQDDGQRS